MHHEVQGVSLFHLSGHIALVTGAGQSVGEGIARVLARQGAQVIVNDLHAERAERVAEAIVADGFHAVPAAFDVTDEAVTLTSIRAAEKSLGSHVDILVNNAGVPEDRFNFPFRELTSDQWSSPINLNIFGALNCTKAVIDGMCTASWGRVIQISSGSARTGQNIGVSMYAAGKSGIEGFIRHLAAEVGQYGVTANSIALGYQANLHDKMPPEMIDALLQTVPIGRFCEPDEVGAFCAYIASPESGSLNGQTIDFNGGTITR